MPVTPTAVNLFQTREEVRLFLLSVQQKLTETVPTKIVNISLEIPPVDPLAVLQQVWQQEQLHFYWEKQTVGEGNTLSNRLAIAAIDAAAYLTVESGNRFERAQKFIQSSLDKTIFVGCPSIPFSGPHFFCSFTFFEAGVKPSKNSSINQPQPFPSATIFLPRWQVNRIGDRYTLVINTVISSTADIDSISQTIWQQINRIPQIESIPFYLLPNRQETFQKFSVESSQKFKRSVGSALDLIRANILKKIVLAQAIDVISPTPFNQINSLHNLRQIYPGCYVFSTSNSQGQKFIGASPEKLIGIESDRLIADALAGSAPRGKTPVEDATLANSLLSSKKDLHEHSFVRDFIVRRLEAFGLKPDFPPQPRLLQLSNIQHLRTPIIAFISGDIHLLEILAELHPTPAVAGVPRDIAREKICQFESFDRSLYAAPIGWIDSRGNGEFAVGIRSALIDGVTARLYAGAGIVFGSQPDKEFAEVQLKLQALLKALV